MNRFKTILIESKHPTFPCVFQGVDEKNNGVGEYEVTDSLIRGAAKYYHLQVIDGNKPIASSDKSLGLPVIHEPYISDLLRNVRKRILKYQIIGGCFIPFIDYSNEKEKKFDFKLLKDSIPFFEALVELHAPQHLDKDKQVTDK